MSSTAAKLLRKKTPAERLAFMRAIAAERARLAGKLAKIVARAATAMELGVIEVTVERAAASLAIEGSDAKRLKEAIRGKAKKLSPENRS